MKMMRALSNILAFRFSSLAVLCALTIGAACVGQAFAQPAENAQMSPALVEGIKAFRIEKYDEAIRRLTPLADGGDVVAQTYLGLIYVEGYGVEPDINKAVEWYSKAAQQGQPDAQYALGLIAHIGRGGFNRNFDTAVKWYELAAQSSHPEALFQLGTLYTDGFGVGRDFKKASQYFEQAGELGHADAQYNLGVFYMTGVGVAQDPMQALKWFGRAGMKGHPDAQYNMGILYGGGMGIEENPAEAAKWLQAAANSGLADAEFVLGVVTLNGRGVRKSEKGAVALFLKAAEKGHPEAQLVLARLLSKGEGAEKDPIEAYKWLELASAQGMEDSTLRGLLEAALTKSEIGDALQRAEDWSRTSRVGKQYAPSGG